MKKNLFLLLPLLLLTSCKDGLALQNERILRAENSSAILNNLFAFLTSPFEMTATRTSYDGTTTEVIDQVSPEERTTTVKDASSSRMRTVFKDEDGNTNELYLNTHNEIETIALNQGDQEETPIDYDSHYGSPFQMIDTDNVERPSSSWRAPQTDTHSSLPKRPRASLRQASISSTPSRTLWPGTAPLSPRMPRTFSSPWMRKES